MTSEYLQFDDEDQENLNARSRISPYGPVEDPYNNRIYYCYYEPSTVILTEIITLIVYKSDVHIMNIIYLKKSLSNFLRKVFQHILMMILKIARKIPGQP